MAWKPCSSGLMPNDGSYFQNLIPTSGIKAVHYSNSLCNVSLPAWLQKNGDIDYAVPLTVFPQARCLIHGRSATNNWWVGEQKSCRPSWMFFDSTNICLMLLDVKNMEMSKNTDKQTPQKLSSLRSLKFKGERKRKYYLPSTLMQQTHRIFHLTFPAIK